MTRLSSKQISLFEQAIYLPLILIVLEKDLKHIESSPLKLKEPYTLFLEDVMKKVQIQLRDVKQTMKKENLRLQKLKQDDSFTLYAFLFDGYEEHHNYFNPRIRNKVNELLTYFFLQKDKNQHANDKLEPN
ncbi:hypothetical protein ACWE42_08870 [Sutcliffiella cohnii]|uniref:YhjD n=1 Tax=Sutcliffiella cohnii TaxID=33932 RepID=A0A223KLY9_9BACI|nr:MULTISPECIES: hypothetical protein [Sutcliffiella]AST90520.1 hypothetical protein BC6307_04125 [Sutcliffiella cohnii]MED4016801.1 hypothetical protein [Sutcliffiella cohnii]WBL16172.1 hypothetical protein O1A01_05940 [Sutcliffiella sp. NC1]